MRELLDESAIMKLINNNADTENGITSGVCILFFRSERRAASQIYLVPTFSKLHQTEGKEILGRRKKPVNNSDIPQHAIETIARCILPDILAYYESKEGQREFQKWLAKKEQLESKEAA